MFQPWRDRSSFPCLSCMPRSQVWIMVCDRGLTDRRAPYCAPMLLGNAARGRLRQSLAISYARVSRPVFIGGPVLTLLFPSRQLSRALGRGLCHFACSAYKMRLYARLSKGWIHAPGTYLEQGRSLPALFLLCIGACLEDQILIQDRRRQPRGPYKQLVRKTTPHGKYDG